MASSNPLINATMAFMSDSATETTVKQPPTEVVEIGKATSVGAPYTSFYWAVMPSWESSPTGYYIKGGPGGSTTFVGQTKHEATLNVLSLAHGGTLDHNAAHGYSRDDSNYVRGALPSWPGRAVRGVEGIEETHIECADCANLQAKIQTAVGGFVETAGLAPNPSDPKYQPDGFKAFQADHTAWLTKLAAPTVGADISSIAHKIMGMFGGGGSGPTTQQTQAAINQAAKSGYQEGVARKGAVDNHKLAAQALASQAILAKVQAHYHDRITALTGKIQNMKDDAARQKLQAQIDSLKAQHKAATRTAAMMSKNPDSDKTAALQLALIQAAQNKPNDLTGMFSQMLQMKSMAQMLQPKTDASIPTAVPSQQMPAPAPQAPTPPAPPVPQPVQSSPQESRQSSDIRVVDDGGRRTRKVRRMAAPQAISQESYAQDSYEQEVVPVADEGTVEETEFQDALQYSVSGTDDKESQEAYENNTIFDAAPEPCDTGCNT